MKFESLPPRKLRYRTNAKMYGFIFVILNLILFLYWLGLVEPSNSPFDSTTGEYSSWDIPVFLTLIFYIASTLFYYFFIHAKLKKSLQVYNDHILLSDYNGSVEVYFELIETVQHICWSIFCVRMKNGQKFYFHSRYERIDYIWEGIYRHRPELFEKSFYEEVRIKLVQYDHYQKRKEWFFQHKMIDLFNWVTLPLVFIVLAYLVQSRSFEINHEFVYFFRLYLYSLLTLIVTSFVFSLFLKKFIFDRKVKEEISVNQNKSRDVDQEHVIVERVKIFQLVTSSFLFFIIIQSNLNMFSILRVKNHLSKLDIKKGETLIIDNRYNCFDCRYRVQEGDLLVFGHGLIGELVAIEEDIVGEIIYEPKASRSIASIPDEALEEVQNEGEENQEKKEVSLEAGYSSQMLRHEKIYKVPKGHVAMKSMSQGKWEIIFVKKTDLIGRVKK